LAASGGRLTGKILGKPVYGGNKISFVEEFIKGQDACLTNVYAYTDHMSDLGLLLMASNPYVVNPGADLLREARVRGWPILRFKKCL